MEEYELTFQQNLKNITLLNVIFNKLNSDDNKALLFGSSVAKISLGEHDINDYDIAIDSNDENSDRQIMNNLKKEIIGKMFTPMRTQNMCNLNRILDLANNIKQGIMTSLFDDGLVKWETAAKDTNFLSKKEFYGQRHYVLKVDSHITVDIIFVSDIKRFYLSDIDNGLLSYNIATKKIGLQIQKAIIGNNDKDFNVKYIINLCKEKKLGAYFANKVFKIVSKKTFLPKTTFYRIIKKINEGYSYDISELYTIVCSSFVRSFCDKMAQPKCKHKAMFVEYCYTNVAHKLINDCYKKLMENIKDDLKKANGRRFEKDKLTEKAYLSFCNINNLDKCMIIYNIYMNDIKTVFAIMNVSEEMDDTFASEINKILCDLYASDHVSYWLYMNKISSIILDKSIP